MPVRPESYKIVMILFYLLLCTKYLFQQNFAKENIFAVALEIKFARYEAQKKNRLQQVALSSPGKIFASPNSMANFFCVLSSKEKFWLQKIAWKFWLRVIKRRKNNGYDKIAWKFRWLVKKRRKNIGFNK